MELQEEEREVVLAIYDGDPAFSQKSPVTYQYKYGDEGDPKTFLLEITWTENYPNERPTFNLDTFYNKHIKEASKKRINRFLLDEVENLLGSAMTYSLFESLKDKLEDLIADHDTTELPALIDENNGKEPADPEERNSPEAEVSSSKKVKKEQLTKAQKRKQWDRLDSKGEKPRGWNWIDVIHHLSQSGPKHVDPQESTS